MIGCKQHCKDTSFVSIVACFLSACECGFHFSLFCPASIFSVCLSGQLSRGLSFVGKVQGILLSVWFDDDQDDSA